VNISEAELRNVYLPPVATAVAAGAGNIMTSYVGIDGVPGAADRHLISDMLRGELGFDGVALSDAASVMDLVTHGFARDARCGGAGDPGGPRHGAESLACRRRQQSRSTSRPSLRAVELARSSDVAVLVLGEAADMNLECGGIGSFAFWVSTSTKHSPPCRRVCGFTSTILCR
jgi:hypothetical protein